MKIQNLSLRRSWWGFPSGGPGGSERGESSDCSSSVAQAQQAQNHQWGGCCFFCKVIAYMHLPQVGEWLVVRLVTACPNLTNLSLGMHTSITDSGLRKILASNRWNSFLESCWVLLVEEQNPNWEKLIRAINYIISILSLSELRHFKCTQSKHLSMESVSMLLDSCKVRAQSSCHTWKT